MFTAFEMYEVFHVWMLENPGEMYEQTIYMTLRNSYRTAVVLGVTRRAENSLQGRYRVTR